MSQLSTLAEAILMSDVHCSSDMSLEGVQRHVGCPIRAADAAPVGNLDCVIAVRKLGRQGPTLFRCDPHPQQVPLAILFLHAQMYQPEV